MDLIWIVIGLMAFCMPHLSASSVGVGLAWAGLPYPAELLGMLFVLVMLALVGIPQAWKEHLSTASLVTAVVLVLFECACGVLTQGAAGNLNLSFVGEVLHVVTAGLWLVHASLGDSKRPLGTRISRAACLLFAASGIAWYVAMAAIRTARFAWNYQLEVALWIATGVWVLPYLVALWTCNYAPRQFAVLATMPLAGTLVGNRLWWLVSLFAAPKPEGIATAWVAVAPVLACVGLVFVWMGTGERQGGNPCGERYQVPSDPEGTWYLSPKETVTGCSHLPLQRLAAYETLSEREREVLLQSLEGKSAAQIARDSGLAPTTVRTYLVRAFEKLGVSDARELLVKLRSSVEGAAEQTSTEAEETPTFSLSIIIAVPAVTIMIVALLVGLLPGGGPRNLAGLALAAAALVVGLVRQRPAEETLLWVPVFALLAGSSIALVTVAVALGPSTYLVRRAIIGLAFVAATLWLTRQARNLVPFSGALTCAFAGLVAVCLIPRGIRAQLLIHGVAVLPLAAVMLLVAWLLVRRATSDELASVASATLTGDERVLAYLTGRGLQEMVAQVALLTARDYPLSGIASTIGLSESTVTHYRKRAYDELEVKDKAGLIALLQKEAGL